MEFQFKEPVQTPEEQFKSLVKAHITRTGIDKLMNWLCDKSDFFKAPASTKYHGSVEGGLVKHCLNVFNFLCKEVEYSNINYYPMETIAIVSLFHDLCKANYYKIGYRNVKDEQTGKWFKKEVYEIDDQFPVGHSEKSIIMLQNFIRLTNDEILAIRGHMGPFDATCAGGNYKLISDIFHKCDLALALHISDMKATYFIEGKEE